MSGASWWATAEAERGPETLIQPNWGSVAFEAGAGWWCWVLAYALQRWRGRRRLNVPVVSIRFARLERERITRSSHWRAHRHLPLRCALAWRTRADAKRSSSPRAMRRRRIPQARNATRQSGPERSPCCPFSWNGVSRDRSSYWTQGCCRQLSPASSTKSLVRHAYNGVQVLQIRGGKDRSYDAPSSFRIE